MGFAKMACWIIFADYKKDNYHEVCPPHYLHYLGYFGTRAS